ncbi:MAG: type I restriction-modification system subunit M N-terminal domain-containing protein, partial [Pyramidobacter sp.]|nr:type I restriction-modification system subunit M N-terminal domain-containing protein [Pyramidobacter sp.]
DALNKAVGTNISEKASLIWNVADVLWGPFKAHEYGLVILPMTVVKRFHDCLLPTWQNVQDSIFPKAFSQAAQDSFFESQQTYQSLFEDKKKYDAIMYALGSVLYRDMQQRTTA